MVSECFSFALAAVIGRPFAKLFQQTKSTCKSGEVVKVGSGGFCGGRGCLFVCLLLWGWKSSVKVLVAGRRKGTIEASANTGLAPSDSDAFNGLAPVSVHMLVFQCWAVD